MRSFLLLLTCIFALNAAEYKNQLSIDPALWGLWYSICSSNDKGVTIKDTGYPICRVSALEVLVGDEDKPYKVVSVKSFTEEDGTVGNVIDMGNKSNVWFVSNSGDGEFLFQAVSFDSDGEVTEKIRHLIKVMR